VHYFDQFPLDKSCIMWYNGELGAQRAKASRLRACEKE
jgi:hypothetical protein